MKHQMPSSLHSSLMYQSKANKKNVSSSQYTMMHCFCSSRSRTSDIFFHLKSYPNNYLLDDRLTLQILFRITFFVQSLQSDAHYFVQREVISSKADPYVVESKVFLFNFEITLTIWMRKWPSKSTNSIFSSIEIQEFINDSYC